jgi:hypothetical protein
VVKTATLGEVASPLRFASAVDAGEELVGIPVAESRPGARANTTWSAVS